MSTKRIAVISLLFLWPAWGLADCTECHPAYKAKDVLESKDDVSACQGELKRAVDEILYVEKRFAVLNRVSKPLADKEVGYPWIQAKMERAKESYDSFLQTDVASLKQLVKDEGKVCEKLRQAYIVINAARDELKKRIIFGIIVLGSLVTLIFGFRAYLKMIPEPIAPERLPRWEYDPERDDEPYRKMAARVSWPEVKPRAEEE